MKKEKLFIIDGHSIIFKIYYSRINRPLYNSKSENITIIHGYLIKLFSIINKYKPDYLINVFDSKEKLKREEIYEKYKANRQKSPEEIDRQTPLLLELLEALGFNILSSPGYEADDIINTIVQNLKNKNNFEIYIYTVDKDLFQLVDSNVFIVATQSKIDSDIIYNIKKVEEKWGIRPDQILDFLSLVGDTSDNIPGVKGIGEKTALQLLKKYNTAENIFKYLNTISSKSIREKLEKGYESFELSKKLIMLGTDVPIDISLEKWKLPEEYGNKGIELLRKYELKSLYEKLTGEKFVPIEAKTIESKNYFLINNIEKLKKIFDNMGKEISFDTETTYANSINSEIIGFSFSQKEGEAFFILIQNNEVRENYLSLLKKYFIEKNFKIIGQNIKYDYKIVSKYGIKFDILFDTMIAAKLFLNDNEKINMDYLALKFLNYKTIKYSEIVKDKNKNLLDYPTEKVKDYACEDADITLQLFNFLKEKVREENFSELFYKIEIPIIKILAEMELMGIKTSKKYLNELKEFVVNKLKELERKIYDLAEEEFLINSTKQLQNILFNKLKLPIIKKGKTGPSTDESVLQILSSYHDLPAKILEYRKYHKLISTYIEPLIKYTDSEGRVHTTYTQAFVATGRLSSKDPNLQNIPVEIESLNLRNAFIADEGYSFLSIDYSQIELRVLAFFSRDKYLIEAIKKDIDIHTFTASLIFNKSYEKVEKFERKIAKTINFGVIYGLSPYGLSKQLNISRKEASNFIINYFKMFEGIKLYKEQLINKVSKTGYTWTLFGRKRYVPQLHKSKNKTDREAGARIAVNTQIQGTAAEIMKIAMIKVFDYINTKYKLEKQWKDFYMKNEKFYDLKNIAERSIFFKSPVRILLQIHDELLFEIKDNLIQEEKNSLKKIMENVMGKYKDWDIPLVCNVKIGKSWGDLK